MTQLAIFLVTVAAGFAADALLGSWLNWPDAGAIVAVAVMGLFILRAINGKKASQDE